MMNSAHTSALSGGSMAASEALRHGCCWLTDCELSQHSPRTIEARRMVLQKLDWFLRDRELPAVDPPSLRAFLAYVGNGHTDPRGRWGNPANRRPSKPGTVATYARHLRAFFNWCVKFDVLAENPGRKLPAIVDRPDEVLPFTPEQVAALLSACSRTRAPQRNRALVLFLLDTAARVSEACGVRMQDVDLSSRTAVLHGKGAKVRTVPLSPTTARALWDYLRPRRRGLDEYVFESERGGPLDRGSVRQLFERLGAQAGVEGAHPHRARHTAAIEFLRGGGNALALQRLLGHTDLAMTRRYAAIVDADLSAQHRLASPVERLVGRGQGRARGERQGARGGAR